jgi:methylamine---glutamate N-methyltransferase subunit B
VVAQIDTDAVVDCDGKSTRDVNVMIKALVSSGAPEIYVRNPAARHSLAVALKAEDVRVVFDGSVGWYCAGMNFGPHIVVHGNAGWGIGECMMGGRIDVDGHAGSGTAASIRGGTVFVRGDTGARAGIAMKGGTLVVGGSVGYMSGFMMQEGTMVVCGDAADGIGDSMYEGTIFVGGSVASFGADAVEQEVTDADRATLTEALTPFAIDASEIGFTKIRAGKKLWNFSAKEPEIWKDAL